MTREKYHALIDNRIMEMQPGSVFVTSDFADIAPTAAINMSLSRLEASGSIRRILRGIYDKYSVSDLVLMLFMHLWIPLSVIPHLQ